MQFLATVPSGERWLEQKRTSDKPNDVVRDSYPPLVVIRPQVPYMPKLNQVCRPFCFVVISSYMGRDLPDLGKILWTGSLTAEPRPLALRIRVGEACVVRYLSRRPLHFVYECPLEHYFDTCCIFSVIDTIRMKLFIISSLYPISTIMLYFHFYIHLIFSNKYFLIF